MKKACLFLLTAALAHAELADERKANIVYGNRLYVHPVALVFLIVPDSPKGFQLEYERDLFWGFSVLASAGFATGYVEIASEKASKTLEQYGASAALRKYILQPRSGPYVTVQYGASYIDLHLEATNERGFTRTYKKDGTSTYLVGLVGWQWLFDRLSIGLDLGMGKQTPGIRPEHVGSKTLDGQAWTYVAPYYPDANFVLGWSF